MINKNIELCKLLNIKPKYRISIYSGTHLVDNLDEVKHLLCDLDMNSKDIIKNAIEIYPDLHKSDNFVKILQIMHEFEVIKDLINVGSYIETILIKAKEVAKYNKVFVRALQDEGGDYNDNNFFKKVGKGEN